MMIELSHSGDFSKLQAYLEKLKSPFNLSVLDKYGKRGVKALSDATPVDTGKTASSWYYTISNKKGRVTLSFHNSNVVDGVPIAIILQYGHGTKNGGYVHGRDYINPAVRPIFDEMAETVWKEVIRS